MHPDSQDMRGRSSAKSSSLSGTNLERAGDYNQRVLLQAIRVGGPLTRADLVDSPALRRRRSRTSATPAHVRARGRSRAPPRRPRPPRHEACDQPRRLLFHRRQHRPRPHHDRRSRFRRPRPRARERRGGLCPPRCGRRVRAAQCRPHARRRQHSALARDRSRRRRAGRSRPREPAASAGGVCDLGQNRGPQIVLGDCFAAGFR